MFIVRVWNFFRGYVIIRIEGLTLEKFINYAISRGVYLWDIKRIDYTTLEAKVGLEGYKELRHIVKRSGCKVKIRTKIGYPFFMHKIKLRKAFSIGFFICIAIIMLSSSFVWEMDIVGNKNLSKTEIEKLLNDLGLYPGTLKYSVDLANIENNMMIELEELAWIGIHIKGTRAIVEIVEKVEPPEKVPLDIPCDIIAAKRGIIEKVTAKNGDALVQRGDIVKEGELLLTGTIIREEADIRYVHALGEVLARTYYEEKDSISLVQINKIKTGNVYKRRIIKIGDNKIILNFSEIPYSDVIIEKKNKRLALWRNIFIPVEIIIEEYYEVIKQKKFIDRGIAKQALQEKMMVKLISKIPEDVKVLNQDIEFNETENTIGAKLVIEALEEIGKQRKIIPIE